MTRREFLERAASSAAVLPLSAAMAGLKGSTTVGPASAGLQAGRMFVSLNGSLTRGVSGADRARLAAKLGYGGVDWDLGPAKTAGVDATRALFSELRITPTIVNMPMARPLPFGGDDAAFQEALKQLADDAAFCAAVGCDRMMVVLPASTTLPKEEQLKLARDRFSAISGVLQKSNVRLGLEFLGPLYFRAGRAGGPPSTPFIWNLPDTVALAKQCGPNIGAILDAWHWHHSGGTTSEIVDAGASRVVHVHISDAKPAAPEDVRDNQRFMPGEGVIDLVGFLQALNKIGYAGGISPEPLGRVPPEMSPEDAARLALETTRSVMKRAGI
jgi:sugar phosphate isomerase/epimerase